MSRLRSAIPFPVSVFRLSFSSLLGILTGDRKPDALPVVRVSSVRRPGGTAGARSGDAARRRRARAHPRRGRSTRGDVGGGRAAVLPPRGGRVAGGRCRRLCPLGRPRQGAADGRAGEPRRGAGVLFGHPQGGAPRRDRGARRVVRDRPRARGGIAPTRRDVLREHGGAGGEGARGDAGAMGASRRALARDLRLARRVPGTGVSGVGSEGACPSCTPASSRLWADLGAALQPVLKESQFFGALPDGCAALKPAERQRFFAVGAGDRRVHVPAAATFYTQLPAAVRRLHSAARDKLLQILQLAGPTVAADACPRSCRSSAR